VELHEAAIEIGRPTARLLARRTVPSTKYPTGTRDEHLDLVVDAAGEVGVGMVARRKVLTCGHPGARRLPTVAGGAAAYVDLAKRPGHASAAITLRIAPVPPGQSKSAEVINAALARIPRA